MGFLLHDDRLRVMEKKLTNSGPLRESVDKHSIYPVVAIGKALQPFPCPKRSVRLSPHSAFQLGLWTLEERMRRHRRRGAPVAKDRHLLSPLHPFASLLTGLP